MGTGVFDCIDAQSFEVGHTHNEGDQRFAVVGSTLSRQGTLEDPQAFQKLIQDKVNHIDSLTQLHAEILHDSCDWAGWLEPLGLKWSGHTSHRYTKKRGQVTVRVFRFMKRKELTPAMQQDCVSEFLDPPNMNDVVLLTKLNISDNTYVGPAQVCLPFVRLATLPERPEVAPC